MITVNVRHSLPADVAAIGPRVCEIEALECAAMGRTPSQSLEIGLRGSAWVRTVEIDGHPEAVIGLVVSNLLYGEGSPWMLGSAKAKVLARRQFLLLGRAYVPQMEAITPRLCNAVHRDNAPSIRWLERLGFTVEPEVVDIGGQPMRRFTKGI